MYDFDRELEELTKGIKLNPLTIVIGIRRSGKTSLLRVALNEIGYPYIYVDPRFSEAPTYRDFAYILRDSLEDFLGRYGDLRERIIKFLRSVRGVSISTPGFSVEVSWRGSERLELGELLVALNSLGGISVSPLS